MARISVPAPEIPGEGSVHFAGYEGPAHFVTRGEPSSLRAGPGTLRGALLLQPELAEAAFRSGQARLTLPSGVSYRLTFLGHTAGDDRTYFEMRV
jgi:hypothetical protein